MKSLIKLKILVVDDDPSFTDSFIGFLRDEQGHTVFLATNTADAVKIIKQQKDLNLPVDLAIIDYVMPEKENGITISHELKKIDQQLFCVALTEHGTPEIVKKLIQEGDFIQIISKFDSEDTILKTLGVIFTSKKERQTSGVSGQFDTQNPLQEKIKGWKRKKKRVEK